jgi:hypothetical protein
MLFSWPISLEIVRSSQCDPILLDPASSATCVPRQDSSDSSAEGLYTRCRLDSHCYLFRFTLILKWY